MKNCVIKAENSVYNVIVSQVTLLTTLQVCLIN